MEPIAIVAGLIYLDACAIIDAIEKPTAEGQALINLIVEGAGTDTPFITSDLSLAEVLVDPIRGLIDRAATDENPESRFHHDWYVGNLTPDGLLIQTRAMDRDILVQAAVMRARVQSLKVPDAIHAATAYRFNCTHFVTGDAKLIRGIQRDPAWSISPRRFNFVTLSVDALDALRNELTS